MGYQGGDNRPLVLISEITGVRFLCIGNHHEHNRSRIQVGGGKGRRGMVGRISERERMGCEGEKRETYKIEVSSGSVSSGISSPTDAPRGRLVAPTAEVKNPIIVSVFCEGGRG